MTNCTVRAVKLAVMLSFAEAVGCEVDRRGSALRTNSAYRQSDAPLPRSAQVAAAMVTL